MKLSLQILKVKKEKVRNAGNGPHPYRVSRARPAFTQPWLHGRGRGVSLDLIFDDGPHSAQRSGLVCGGAESLRRHTMLKFQFLVQNVDFDNF